jgi:hypothetical protein
MQYFLFVRFISAFPAGGVVYTKNSYINCLRPRQTDGQMLLASGENDFSDFQNLTD